tara:strand:+ start:382 stop:807 length:426 start_codon:yes stop_codon:yes gene_type:complete
MIITIKIDNKDFEIEVTRNDKIQKIKEEIIEKFYKNKETNFWIEFIYRGDRTIREFCKHNLIMNEQIPSTMDNLSLSDYSDKDYKFIFEICESVIEPVVKPKVNNSSSDKYIPTFKRGPPTQQKPKEYVVEDYNDEFPPLG